MSFHNKEISPVNAKMVNRSCVKRKFCVLEEQSDQGLHGLPFRLHLLDALLYGNAILLNIEGDYSNFLRCPTF